MGGETTVDIKGIIDTNLFYHNNYRVSYTSLSQHLPFSLVR